MSDETWTADDDRVLVVGNAFEPTYANDPRMVERAKLAVAAPEMARLLLEIQHTPTGYDHEPCCPICGLAAKSNRKDWPHGHAPDCGLVAVLRKAGVIADKETRPDG